MLNADLFVYLMVTANVSLCVQSRHTFLKQRHGSSGLFLLVVFVLHTYKVLQQLSEIDVLVVDNAVFCRLAGLYGSATHNTAT